MGSPRVTMGTGTPKRERGWAPQQHLHHLARLRAAVEKDEQNQTKPQRNVMKPEAGRGWRVLAGRRGSTDTVAQPQATLCLLSPWGGFHNENDYLLFLPWK